MKLKKYLLAAAAIISLNAYTSEAEFSLLTEEICYENSLKSYQEKDWPDLFMHTQKFIHKFIHDDRVNEIFYYHALSAYNMKQYELASRYFSEYLQQSKHLQYFDEALQYQFQIAEAFRHGVKKSLFGIQKMPKLLSAYEDAIKLYDEVIKTMPHHELAAQSLYAKGEVHLLIEDYRESIDALQLLIQRFPKHELALDSYLLIGKVYLAQCNEHHQDISLLDLATINLQRFERDFPKEEEKVQQVKNMIGEMNEIFAKSFLEIARYYDRVKKLSASEIYYSKIVRTFPDTNAAQFAQKRLTQIQAKKA